MALTKFFFLTVFFLVFLSYFSYAGNDKIESSIFEQLERTNEVEVIINVRNIDGDIPRDEQAINKVIDYISKNNVEKIFKNGAFIARLNEKEILEIADHENVLRIESIKYLKPLLYDSINITGASDSWNIEIDGISLDGNGQTICIVDTGVDFSHPDLTSKNILGGNLDCFYPNECFLNNSSQDLLGHGRGVAGIAAAGGGINGISKGANIISAKVFKDGDISSSSLDVLQAIIWCTDHAEEYDISVISTSLGYTEFLYASECDADWPFYEFGIDYALQKNISFVAASGNDGNHALITAPACLSEAIAVGATNKDDTISIGSNYNSLVKLFAPGVNITSTQVGGGYNIFSGTSAASPMVSASIAIINQYLELSGQGSKTILPSEIEQMLYSTGFPINVDGFNFTRINIYDVLLSMGALETDEVLPVVNLISPIDGNIKMASYNSSVDIMFICEASDDVGLGSLSLAVKKKEDGSLAYYESKSISGTYSQESFNVPLYKGEYLWNCEAEDTSLNTGSASEDYDIRIISPILPNIKFGFFDKNCTLVNC